MEHRSTLVALMVAALSGCDAVSPNYNCTDIGLPGIHVRVQDSLTGSWAASGATLTLSDAGGFSESMTFAPDRPQDDENGLWGAVERTGTYLVTVTKPGYNDWQKSNVHVTEDQCHVRTVSLIARLQKP